MKNRVLLKCSIMSVNENTTLLHVIMFWISKPCFFLLLYAFKEDEGSIH